MSGLQVFPDVVQGSQEWLDQRRGLLTASVVGKLITPATRKVANNATSRGLVLELAAERITGYSEPFFESHDMERGTLDEPYARDIYAEHHAPVVEVGFMTRTINDATLGYSPDGLVGDDGLIEIKSRKQKIQLDTFLTDTVPSENMAQIQCGLLVSGRAWCDYVSYCGGMHLYVKRVLPDEGWFAAIKEALKAFEVNVAEAIKKYEAATTGRPLTVRIDHFEEMI